eukprot:IDg6966t1
MKSTPEYNGDERYSVIPHWSTDFEGLHFPTRPTFLYPSLLLYQHGPYSNRFRRSADMASDSLARKSLATPTKITKEEGDFQVQQTAIEEPQVAEIDSDRDGPFENGDIILPPFDEQEHPMQKN